MFFSLLFSCRSLLIIFIIIFLYFPFFSFIPFPHEVLTFFILFPVEDVGVIVFIHVYLELLEVLYYNMNF